MEKKIDYGQLQFDKSTAFIMINDALEEIKKDDFNTRLLENSAPLDTITNAVKTLYQIAYANSLVIIEKPEIQS